MTTYLANFSADGTSFSSCITDTNKARLYKDIHDIAKENCRVNGTATFYIADEWGKTILTGFVKSGRVVRVTKNIY